MDATRPNCFAALLRSLLVLLSLAAALAGSAAPKVTIATYNLENYLDTVRGSRPVKSAGARARIREAILQIRPEILALQEVGGTNELLELRQSLGEAGWELPHWDLVRGYDTNIFVGLLSRFPIIARRPHETEGFLLRGRRFRLTRGILEADFEPGPGYRLTLMAVHLKSRRESTEAAQEEIREEEARVLRRLVDSCLQRNPQVNLVVLGDFNDVKDSRAMRLILGRGRTALLDSRPAERNGDKASAPGRGLNPRMVTWTHFYGKEDTYSRVDYILLSPGMARELDRMGTYILAWPDWGEASDHRPVVARFECADQGNSVR